MNLIEFTSFGLLFFFTPPLNSNNDLYTYRLRLVEKITDSIIEKTLYRTNVRSFVDTSELTADIRSRMCERALGNRMLTRRQFYVHDDKHPEEEKLYALHFSESNTIYSDKVLRPELVFAFQCPTFPSIYLQVYDEPYFGKVVWVITEERSLPPEIPNHNFPGYVFYPGRHFDEASSSSSSGLRNDHERSRRSTQ